MDVQEEVIKVYNVYNVYDVYERERDLWMKLRLSR